MEYGDKILKRIKSAIGRKFHKLVSIEKFDELNHKVTYIELDYNYINKPQFSIMHAFFDFKVDLRDSRIDFLLTNKEENDEETFDVENIIYSEEQRKIIEKLRQTNSQYKSAHDILEEVKIEYSKSFNVGDTVYYNNRHGIITFKHNYKKGNQQLWSVKTFVKKHGYDPRVYANDRLKYYTYEIEQESEEEDEWGFEEPKEPIYVIELHYGEVTRHDCPYSITTSYFLDDFKKEIRDIQIEKIL